MRPADTLTPMHGRLFAPILGVMLLAACASPAPPEVAPGRTEPHAPLTTPTLWPTKAPTPTPRPTPTAEPTATPTGPGSPSTLSLSADEIGSHLDALMSIATDNGGIRASGTDGYVASAEYVNQQLTDMGFSVEYKPFDFVYFDEAAPVELSVGDQSWTGSE